MLCQSSDHWSQYTCWAFICCRLHFDFFFSLCLGCIQMFSNLQFEWICLNLTTFFACKHNLSSCKWCSSMIWASLSHLHSVMTRWLTIWTRCWQWNISIWLITVQFQSGGGCSDKEALDEERQTLIVVTQGSSGARAKDEGFSVWLFIYCVQTSVMQVNGQAKGNCFKSDPLEIGCCPRSLTLTCSSDLVPSTIQWKSHTHLQH